ncbi:metalloregulator ArsR/SmtB family transcription factor [Microbacterium thalli]|uniref:Metalloregulator ArsR/SmtB family transcription factor n=1 Tax=Microbacterium thalli TaxID=3027921 RepID=A0ABT5SLL2_9MICO|nr:metalloregulator ArsR/SmtB family transcription factor [Microbacterium thalli]MDD7929902.1 metalloregulator ArsR/SmtB family transcription factor [Microbacterium thalli]MDD7963561.1 metalloregulator ArsR/SmtB family transcription factor [Microbacterium thalli]MDN8549567.1 metalloregulator ArsR/SmtB family transcription factor [Microbacterium thalli]
MSTTTSTTADDACAPSTTLAIGDDAAAALATTLKALSDPLRLRMLSAIATDARGESCVCDLAELADVSQPTVSHHLKVLRDTGVLTSERRGTWVWYRITPALRPAVTTLLDSFAPAAIAPPTRSEHTGLENVDDALTHLADRLGQQHPTLDRSLIMTIVRESYTSLAKTARVKTHLLSLTDRFTRQRLADITRDRSQGQPQVLFVCVANAGRSQLAAALMNQRSGGSVIARSAGSTPAAEIHPHVQPLLDELNPDGDQETRFPKPLTDDAVRAADVVITMGCGDVCPIIPGVRYEDWNVGDPALASTDGVAAIRDDIARRVDNLLNTLTTTR